MENYNRDLLVLYKDELGNNELLQHEVACLHKILLGIENDEAFCVAHELATRNRITNKTRAIIRATEDLKPFHFLINKN